ncbi:RFC checkpoint protein Rad17 [Sorochytrium milnesiophthora]
MLVLTGPTGGGKTAALQVLSRDLNFEIVEWINPIHSSSIQRLDEDYGQPSSMAAFTEFLAAGNKYPSLVLEGGTQSGNADGNARKVLLVEDVPFMSSTTAKRRFNDAIRSYALSPRAQVPLVMIVSESSASFNESSYGMMDADAATSPRLLVPPDILDSPYCTTITFNAVARTIVIKALRTIAVKELLPPPASNSRKSSKKSKPKTIRKADIPPDTAALLDAVATAANGDIRSAVNTLQFAAVMADEVVEPVLSPSAVKRLRSGKAKAQEAAASRPAPQHSISCKDPATSIWSSVGRVLYNKRTDDPDEEDTTKKPEPAPLLPDYAQAWLRAPMKTDPEELIAGLPISPALYICFLHANYPLFYTSVAAATFAADHLSLADQFVASRSCSLGFSGVWQSYGGSIANRGLYFAHDLRDPVCPAAYVDSQDDNGGYGDFDDADDDEFDAYDAMYGLDDISMSMDELDVLTPPASTQTPSSQTPSVLATPSQAHTGTAGSSQRSFLQMKKPEVVWAERRRRERIEELQQMWMPNERPSSSPLQNALSMQMCVNRSAFVCETLPALRILAQQFTVASQLHQDQLRIIAQSTLRQRPGEDDQVQPHMADGDIVQDMLNCDLSTTRPSQDGAAAFWSAAVDSSVAPEDDDDPIED